MRRHERPSPCLIGSPTTLAPAAWAMTHPSAMARLHRPTAKKPAPRPRAGSAWLPCVIGTQAWCDARRSRGMATTLLERSAATDQSHH
jgi:hypothetical protein